MQRNVYYDSLSNWYPKPEVIASPGSLINLITILDYLSLDEIVSNLLENVNICGIASKSVWADGRHLNPFLFLDHDLTHGANYIGICYSLNGLDRDNLLSFYNFCKGTITDKKQLYSVTFMMFLLIHEGWCDFFRVGMTELSRKDFLATPLLNTGRFLDNNDLGLSIPKEYRQPEPEEYRPPELQDKDGPSLNYIIPIRQYFDDVAIPNYLKAIASWSESLHVGKGGTKSGNRKSKKSRKGKTQKKRKICRCRRGGTKKETPKAKAAKASRKRTPTAEVAYEDRVEKDAFITSLATAIDKPKKSVARSLAKIPVDEVRNMSTDDFKLYYKMWRNREALGRRNLRHKTPGISAKSALTDEDAVDALMLFKQPSHNIDSPEDFIDATTEDWIVSPGAKKTIEESDTYDKISGFTPIKAKRDNRKTHITSVPTDLFKFSPLNLGTREEEEEDEDAVLRLMK